MLQLITFEDAKMAIRVHTLLQVDLVSQYGRPAFGLEYYLEAQDLGQLAALVEDSGRGGGAFLPRFRRLTAALCEARSQNI